MKEKLKSAIEAVLGFGIIFLILLLISFYVKGIIWIADNVLDWLFIIMWIVFALNIIILLPLFLIKKTRTASAIGLHISSYIYGMTLWFWGLIITYIVWGGFAVFLGLFLLGGGVVPIAILASIINGQWAVAGELFFLIILTFGTRIISNIVLDSYEQTEYYY